MKKTRTQKATLNVMTSTISEVVSIICALILPRFILQNFGSAYNGIVTSATQFLSLISVLTLGITASTRVALYKTLANDDLPRTSSIVRAMDLYMRKVGIILLFYIFVLAGLYPLLVDTGYSYFDVALLIVIVGISSFAEYFFGITYKTFLAADQCGYITNIFITVSTILNTVVSVVLIQFGFSIQVVKLGSAIIYFLRPLLQNLYVKHHYKLNVHCEPDNTAIKNRKDAVAHALANIVHDHTDMIVLTVFTDVKTVSVYTVYNLVMVAIKKAQTILTTGIEPVLGNMWVKGEVAKIKRNLSLFEFVMTAFVSIVFSITLVMLLPFISLYTQGVTDIEYIRPVYAVVIVAAFAIQGFRAPYLALVQGIGHYKETKKGAIAEAAINLITSVIMVQFFGLVGVAIGTLAANIFRTLQYALYIDNNVIHRGKRTFILKMVWSVINIFIIAWLATPIMNYIEHWTWLSWVLVAFAVAIISAIVVISSSLVFYRTDFKGIIELLNRMLKRKKRKRV